MILEASLFSKSGRLSLVPPSKADDASVAAARSHPDTRRFLRFMPPHFSESDARTRRLAREPDTSLVDFNIHTQDGTFIGTTGIFNIDNNYGRTCELGILIAPAFVRGGFGTEAIHAMLEYAFEQRGRHRVEFYTQHDNAPMRSWFEAAGVTYEGIRRGVVLDPVSGEYVDVCGYSVLEDEWRNTVKGRLEARINRLVGQLIAN